MADTEPHTAARALRSGDRLASALELGAWVLDEVFPRGDTLRSAAREVELPPSTLQRYVAVTKLCRRLGRNGFDHLSVSHLKLILALPEPQQDALIARAEAERWTVAQLRSATRTAPVDALAPLLRRVEAWQREIGGGDRTSFDRASALLVEIRAVLDTLRRLEAGLARIREATTDRSGSSPTEPEGVSPPRTVAQDTPERSPAGRSVVRTRGIVSDDGG